VLVAVVGLDANTRALVAAAIARDDAPPSLRAPRTEPPAGTGGAAAPSLELVQFDDIESARAELERQPTSDVILVAEGSALRKRRSFPTHVHVLALVGPDLAAIAALAADDLLRRPFSAAELAIRLAAAARRLMSEQRTTMRGVLGRAMRAGQSGEVIVSFGADSARVHVDHGRVAWVHRASQPVSIRSLLRALGVDVDEATCRDVFEESRASRRHFADVLVEWGLIDADRMRTALHRYIAAQIGELLAEPSLSATFVQETRAFASAFAFDEQEILAPRRVSRIETLPELPQVRAPSVRPASGVPHQASAWFARASCIEEVLASVLVDPRSGEMIERSGMFEESGDRIVWSLIASFVALGDDGGELLANAHGTTYLARAAPRGGGILVIRFESSRLSPAMARLLLARID
jgi:hypothetical protein